LNEVRERERERKREREKEREKERKREREKEKEKEKEKEREREREKERNDTLSFGGHSNASFKVSSILFANWGVKTSLSPSLFCAVLQIESTK
jgi:hypothetical protein